MCQKQYAAFITLLLTGYIKSLGAYCVLEAVLCISLYTGYYSAVWKGITAQKNYAKAWSSPFYEIVFF